MKNTLKSNIENVNENPIFKEDSMYGLQVGDKVIYKGKTKTIIKLINYLDEFSSDQLWGYELDNGDSVHWEDVQKVE